MSRCVVVTALAGGACAIVAAAASAQQAASSERPAAEQTPQQVVVVGSRIQGAKVTELLPVVVLSEEDIQTVAATSGDDLLRSVAQAPKRGFVRLTNFRRRPWHIIIVVIVVGHAPILCPKPSAGS